MMDLCSYCGAKRQAGSLFCEECGQYLVGVEQRPSGSSVTASPPLAAPLTEERERTDRPSAENMVVTLVIPSSGRRLTLRAGQEIRVGREDPQAKNDLDVDLTEEDGAELGVSRLHASIRSSDRGIILVDLDSTNGTRLNSRGIVPRQSYVLRDGDEIQFGKLLMEVHIN